MRAILVLIFVAFSCALSPVPCFAEEIWKCPGNVRTSRPTDPSCIRVDVNAPYTLKSEQDYKEAIHADTETARGHELRKQESRVNNIIASDTPIQYALPQGLEERVNHAFAIMHSLKIDADQCDVELRRQMRLSSCLVFKRHALAGSTLSVLVDIYNDAIKDVSIRNAYGGRLFRLKSDIEEAKTVAIRLNIWLQR